LSLSKFMIHKKHWKFKSNLFWYLAGIEILA
jgi:hypothetical protein